MARVPACGSDPLVGRDRIRLRAPWVRGTWGCPVPR